jgi:3-oxoacyl-[acyl-carrier-protein] synthase-1
VITGLGIISCLGCDTDTVTASLRQGRSGIVLDPERKRLGFRSSLTGSLLGFNPEVFGLGRRITKTMAEPAQYAYAALTQALQQARLDAEQLAGLNAGIIFGNDSTVRPGVEAWESLQAEHSSHYLGAGAIFKTMNSTITMNLATHFKIKGANWTLSAACASGAHAIGQASLLIKTGLQEVVLCGGAQEINPHCMAPFDALNAFSLREHAPEQASRPFDKDRDGLVPSGGAAALVLENAEHAQRRGVPILGEVLGYGFSSDGHHLSLPSSEGGLRAMRMALQSGGVKPEAIEYVNAHATSTLQGDAAEAQALVQLFPHKPWISSTKSMTGHECWMAGASEAVYCTLMARAGFVAGNFNFQEGDTFSRELRIPAQAVEQRLQRVLSNSFGFGGTNASLVFGY